MAKKKLFGNHIEPSCETCALGMVSSDGETVLCRHAGAPSKYHSCKKFRYDPLKRTPRREPVLETFNASDFSLMDPADELMEPMKHDEPTEDPVRDAMLDTLRSYLDTTDAPNADDILELLSVSAESVEESIEDIVEESAEDIAEETDDRAVADDGTLSDELLDDTLLTEDDTAADSADTQPAESEDEPTADDTDTIDFESDEEYHSTFLASEEDIRRDMEQFTVEVHKGASTRAAFNHFAVEFSEEDVDEIEAEDEDEPVLTQPENPALFLDVESENAFEAAFASENPLLSDDLLFLNLDHLDGETIESLVLNEDGSLSTMTEEL